jgi:hypothetical protein
MGTGIYVIAGTLGVWGIVVTADFTASDAPGLTTTSSLPAKISLRCSLIEGKTFAVSVDFAGQQVRFDHGPNIPMSDVWQNGDRVLIRGRSDWFDMEAMIGREISITLGEKESALQTVSCTRVTP